MEMAAAAEKSQPHQGACALGGMPTIQLPHKNSLFSVTRASPAAWLTRDRVQSQRVSSLVMQAGAEGGASWSSQMDYTHNAAQRPAGDGWRHMGLLF